MDAYVSRGASPAACAGGGSQEAEHCAQEVEEDEGQDQTEDVQAVLTVIAVRTAGTMATCCAKKIPTDHIWNSVGMLERKQEVVSCCPMVEGLCWIPRRSSLDPHFFGVFPGSPSTLGSSPDPRLF